jgi:O-6-methylguanine DNA methyltransferase
MKRIGNQWERSASDEGFPRKRRSEVLRKKSGRSFPHAPGIYDVNTGNPGGDAVEKLYLALYEWECGIFLASDGEVLLSAGFDPDRVVSDLRKKFPGSSIEWNPFKLKTPLRQLEEYLQGKRTVFDVPVQLCGTRFQIKVWNEIKKIPYGQTDTYGNIAKKLGDVRLTRAVGRAAGANPIPLVIPCHRVVGTRDRLGGYLGGPAVKRRLLELETREARQP